MSGRISDNVVDKNLWLEIRKEAKNKFEHYPSAYASFWISKEYKRRNGRYYTEKEKDNSLDRWKEEKWVNVCKKDKQGNYIPCGRKNSKNNQDYPLCRPSVRVNNKTPKTVWEIDETEIKNKCKSKNLLKPDFRYQW